MAAPASHAAAAAGPAAPPIGPGPSQTGAQAIQPQASAVAAAAAAAAAAVAAVPTLAAPTVQGLVACGAVISWPQPAWDRSRYPVQPYSYEVQFSTPYSPWWVTYSKEITNNQCLLYDLKPDTQYVARVRALAPTGEAGPFSPKSATFQPGRADLTGMVLLHPPGSQSARIVQASTAMAAAVPTYPPAQPAAPARPVAPPPPPPRATPTTPSSVPTPSGSYPARPGHVASRSLNPFDDDDDEDEVQPQPQQPNALLSVPPAPAPAAPASAVAAPAQPEPAASAPAMSPPATAPAADTADKPHVAAAATAEDAVAAVADDPYPIVGQHGGASATSSDWSALAMLRVAMERETEMRVAAEHRLQLLSGSPAVLSGCSEPILAQLQLELETALAAVKAELQGRKVRAGLPDDVLCIACVDHRKTVLLLPCRHLCLCLECSQLPTMTNCPMCRALIIDRICAYM